MRTRALDQQVDTDIDTDFDFDIEAHRVELTGFCYRMLGSAFDAEDAVQETLIRAWRARTRFEGRSSLRTWLFGIAANVCIDQRNARQRRALPMDLSTPSAGDARPGPPAIDLPWITPIADARVLATGADPAMAAEARASIRLAFVAALQHLNPRQRAVLILRDVLRWKASEVAELLDCSTVSVNGLLRRARSALAGSSESAQAGPPDSAGTSRAVVDRYVEAFVRYDVDAMVALLHDEVVLSMPPHLYWLQGAEAVRTWLLAASPACRASHSRPVTANGSPALAVYREGEPFAIQVMDVADGLVTAIHAFIDPTLFSHFDAPSLDPWD